MKYGHLCPNFDKFYKNSPQNFDFKIRRHPIPEMGIEKKCIGVEEKKSYHFSFGITNGNGLLIAIESAISYNLYVYRNI